jgi:hypothetical protein
LVASAAGSPAHATLVRGLTLPELVRLSDHVLLLTALDRESHYTEVGGRRMMVTDTRARVEGLVAKSAPGTTELLLRTLGGRVGAVAELVHGQAELALGAPCLAFLVRGEGVEHWTAGLAQGHYPLSAASDAEALLRASPRLPTIARWRESAVKNLVGQRLSVARRLVAEMVGR